MTILAHYTKGKYKQLIVIIKIVTYNLILPPCLYLILGKIIWIYSPLN